MKKFLSIILIITISLSILVISLEIHTFSLRTYETSYDKYNLGLSTGITKGEFLEISKDIIKYLKENEDVSLMERNFNSREVAHMEDVQELFVIAKVIKYISLVLVATIFLYLYILKNIDKHLPYIAKGLSINYLIAILFALMVKIDFTKYFTYFHEIFFNNDLWILNPKTDLLIQMMPEIFFIDMVIKIGLTYLGGIALIQALIYIGGRLNNKKNILK